MKKRVVISERQNQRVEIPHVLAGVLCSRVLDDLANHISDENVSRILKEKWKSKLELLNNIAKPINSIVEERIHVNPYKHTCSVLTDRLPLPETASGGVIQRVGSARWVNSRGKPITKMLMPEYPREIEKNRMNKSNNIEIVYSCKVNNDNNTGVKHNIDNNTGVENNRTGTLDSKPTTSVVTSDGVLPLVYNTSDAKKGGASLDVDGDGVGFGEQDIIVNFEEYLGDPSESCGTYVTGRCTKVWGNINWMCILLGLYHHMFMFLAYSSAEQIMRGGWF